MSPHRLSSTWTVSRSFSGRCTPWQSRTGALELDCALAPQPPPLPHRTPVSLVLISLSFRLHRAGCAHVCRARLGPVTRPPRLSLRFASLLHCCPSCSFIYLSTLAAAGTASVAGTKLGPPPRLRAGAGHAVAFACLCMHCPAVCSAETWGAGRDLGWREGELSRSCTLLASAWTPAGLGGGGRPPAQNFQHWNILGLCDLCSVSDAGAPKPSSRGLYEVGPSLRSSRACP